MTFLLAAFIGVPLLLAAGWAVMFAAVWAVAHPGRAIRWLTGEGEP